MSNKTNPSRVVLVVLCYEFDGCKRLLQACIRDRTVLVPVCGEEEARAT
jgi:hypothetical protein